MASRSFDIGYHKFALWEFRRRWFVTRILLHCGVTQKGIALPSATVRETLLWIIKLISCISACMTYVLLQMVFPSTARCRKILNIKNGNERTFLGWRPWALRQPDWPQQSYNSCKLVLVSITLPAIIPVTGGKVAVLFVETAYSTIHCVYLLWLEINMLRDIFLRW